MRPRRHPCEVTSDRLGDLIDRYHDHLTGRERDVLSEARFICEQIAEGTLYDQRDES